MIQNIKRFLGFSKKAGSYPLEHLYLAGETTISGGLSSYKNNVIVNRCVNIVAQSAGHVPWLVMKKLNNRSLRSTDHPLNSLLKKPNPFVGGAEFFAELISNKLLFGNSYILAISDQSGSKILEMHSLRPDCVQVVCQKGAITGYRYSKGNKDVTYPVNPITHKSQILHLKNYNPMSELYGLSCLESAKNLIELHNRATQWNHTLLKNGARPSGAIVVDKGSFLSEEQFNRIKEQLSNMYSGSGSAGKPMLLEGGLDWKEMSISPKDMDFIESRNCAAREIALAFGVPPQLLGINGDNTYSNMQEARMALWEETLIPLLDKIADSLTNWLSSWFYDEPVIDFDRDWISMLTDKRQKLWSSLNEVSFMSVNEKRAMAGLAPIEGGDKL